MTMGWMIFLAGIGTYLMRSAGAWVPPQWFRAKWLNHLPFAVIFVMAIGSVLGFVDFTQAHWRESVGAIAASLVVTIASLRNLPLVGCIALGCLVFGLFNPDL